MSRTVVQMAWPVQMALPLQQACQLGATARLCLASGQNTVAMVPEQGLVTITLA